MPPDWLSRHLPAALSRTDLLGVAWWQWLGLVVAVVLAFGLAAIASALLRRLMAGITGRTRALWDDELVAATRGPTRLLFFVLGAAALLPLLFLQDEAAAFVGKALRISGITAGAWYAFRALDLTGRWLERHWTAGGNALDQRSARTRIVVLRRVAYVLALVVAVAVILLQFDAVRSVGVSLLASAGLAGIVLGFAAQKSLGSLFAGIQISLTQPIRLGDAVLVEGEFGTVEEINLTYVIVKVWDERRLIVPVSKFLETPFQNWTRISPELLGTIVLFADYDVDVDAARAELTRLTKEDARWDGRTAALQVTEVTETTVQLRGVVSARDAGSLWDLRCSVREGMVAWLRSHRRGRFVPRRRFVPVPTDN